MTVTAITERGRAHNSFSDNVAPFHGIRIEPERDGDGWIVITANGNGWILGSRSDALREKRWHDRQWGRA